MRRATWTVAHRPLDALSIDQTQRSTCARLQCKTKQSKATQRNAKQRKATRRRYAASRRGCGTSTSSCLTSTRSQRGSSRTQWSPSCTTGRFPPAHSPPAYPSTRSEYPYPRPRWQPFVSHVPPFHPPALRLPSLHSAQYPAMPLYAASREDLPFPLPASSPQAQRRNCPSAHTRCASGCLRLVLRAQIFPAEYRQYLPTFCSSAIECFIDRIPALSSVHCLPL